MFDYNLNIKRCAKTFQKILENGQMYDSSGTKGKSNYKFVSHIGKMIVEEGWTNAWFYKPMMWWFKFEDAFLLQN